MIASGLALSRWGVTLGVYGPVLVPPTKLLLSPPNFDEHILTYGFFTPYQMESPKSVYHVPKNTHVPTLKNLNVKHCLEGGEQHSIR